MPSISEPQQRQNIVIASGRYFGHRLGHGRASGLLRDQGGGYGLVLPSACLLNGERERVPVVPVALKLLIFKRKK